jgi:hypothetical protein
VEQGLTQPQAARLARDMQQLAGSCPPGALPPPLSLELLSAQVAALTRCLPETPLAPLIAREPGLLCTESGQVITALVHLVRAFPGAMQAGSRHHPPGDSCTRRRLDPACLEANAHGPAPCAVCISRAGWRNAAPLNET